MAGSRAGVVTITSPGPLGVKDMGIRADGGLVTETLLLNLKPLF